MLSFERVLEAFREHLTEDTGVEVVPTRHGYTYLTWDDRRENWDTAEICLTPEALLDSYFAKPAATALFDYSQTPDPCAAK